MAAEGPLERADSRGGRDAGAGSKAPFVDATGRTRSLAVFLGKAPRLNVRASWSVAHRKPMPTGGPLRGFSST